MENADLYTLTGTQQLEKMTLAARDAAALWNMEDAEMELIKHRENAVFKLQIDGGTSFALRVHRLGYHSNDELRSEIQWMQALTEYGVSTPEFIPSQLGNFFESVQVAGVENPFQVDILAWADGEPLGTVEEGFDQDAAELAEIFRKIGITAARVHNQAENWQTPEGFTRHAWDTAGLTGEDPFWGRFWDLEALSAAQRELLLTTRDRLSQDLDAFGASSDRYGLIHADFLPENFLVGKDGIRLIDFDDAGYGWHLFDFATTLFFQQGEPHFESIKQALVEGYRTERNLPDEQLATLPLFLLARGTTYLGWFHTRELPAEIQEMVPDVIEMVCEMARAYLDS